MNKQVTGRCRICYEEQDGCKSLYQRVQQRYLPTLIEYCCDVKISPKDEPNALACLECAIGLIQAEHVIKTFRSTQDILRDQTTTSSKQTQPCENDIIECVGNNTSEVSVNTETNDTASHSETSADTSTASCTPHTRLKKHDYHFVCDLCGFETDYAEYFRRHLMQMHDIEKPRIFKCMHCPEAYVEHRSLRDHIAHVHEHLPRRAKFLCSDCGKGFSKNSHLVRHSYVHNPQKRPFPCDYCAMMFVNRSSAKRHMSSHAEEKTHICVVCKRRYGTVYVLKEHLKHVHGVCEDNEYKCQNCGTVFQKQRMLEYHMTHECLIIKDVEEEKVE